MAKKKVLIVEDEKYARDALCEGLRPNFEVYGAGSVAEARRLAELHWDELDVMVLDIQLADPKDPDISGSDIGIELRRKRWRDPSPEFIVYSEFKDSDYYRLAGKLRGAAYLKKSKHSEPDLFRHVKVLALSHALTVENPATTNRIHRIAAHSENPSKALRMFCEDVLKPEVEACLGTSFVILFSDEKNTLNYAGSSRLPEDCPLLYPLLQDYVHGRKNMSEPFIFEVEQIAQQLDAATASLSQKFDRAAFVPLPIFENFRLSIGILQETVNDRPEPEDAKALGMVLAEYLRPAALENMLKILRDWAALNARLSSTARLCLVVGQELKYLLPVQNPEQDEFEWPEDSLSQLWDLAEDLNDTGQLLGELEAKRWEGKSEPVSIKEIANTSWRLITRAQENAPKDFEIEGNCIVEGDRRDLEIAVSRLLHWLAQRRRATPINQKALVSVKCLNGADGPTIIFEDTSERLSQKLRADMFATFSQAVPVPFVSEVAAHESQVPESKTTTLGGKPEGRYLPLYLAKMLVEGRYHGTLEDHSDDEDIRDLNYGHRIVMQFPPSWQNARDSRVS